VTPRNELPLDGKNLWSNIQNGKTTPRENLYFAVENETTMWLGVQPGAGEGANGGDPEMAGKPRRGTRKQRAAEIAWGTLRHAAGFSPPRFTARAANTHKPQAS
jgi:hypothetical protein